MLIKDVPPGDYQQIFEGTVLYCLKTKEWVYVIGFSADIGATNCRVMSIATKKQHTFPFSDLYFQVKAPKLGMLNIMEHAVFCSRLPKRVMKGAITSDTMTVSIPFRNRDYISAIGLTEHAKCFEPPIVNTFEGIYPSFAEALKMLGKSFSVAFDRQFCVNRAGQIFYKGNTIPVGECDVKNPAIPIKWNAGFESLEFVVGDNCAKALQASKQAPRTRITRD